MSTHLLTWFLGCRLHSQRSPTLRGTPHLGQKDGNFRSSQSPLEGSHPSWPGDDPPALWLDQGQAPSVPQTSSQRPLQLPAFPGIPETHTRSPCPELVRRIPWDHDAGGSLLTSGSGFPNWGGWSSHPRMDALSLGSRLILGICRQSPGRPALEDTQHTRATAIRLLLAGDAAAVHTSHVI